jgi:hypothetical protein
VSDDLLDGRYFAERERAERAMSRAASSRRVAAVHWQMAERYEALAVVFGAKPMADLHGTTQTRGRR